MRAFLRRSRSLLLFMIIPGAASISPLLTYPALTASFGAQGFAAIAIGQSVGLTTAVVCDLGWAVIGPQMAARGERISEIHRASIATRLLVLALGVPVAAVAAYYLAQDFRIASAATAISMSLSALSPIWLLTGLNKPGLILTIDSMPRILLNGVAAAVLWAGGPLVVFALANGACVLISLPLASKLGRFGVWPSRSDFHAAPALIREHLALTAGRSVTVVYTTLLTAVTSALAPGAVALYAGTDRILRMGLSVLAGFPSRLQSWLGFAEGAELRRRIRLVILANTALGVAAAVIFVAAVGPASRILFRDVIAIPLPTALIGGGIALSVCASRGLGLCLVAARRPNAIARAGGFAAAVGIVAAVSAIPVWGANGGLTAALTAELVGILVQALALKGHRVKMPAKAALLPRSQEGAISDINDNS